MSLLYPEKAEGILLLLRELAIVLDFLNKTQYNTGVWIYLHNQNPIGDQHEKL